MILPDDEHNRKLIRNVHPMDWVNPEPAEKYNLVVIGAGPAGLVAAAIAAALGAKVALVERHLMGGDCLNVGCVPSKGLIRAARAWMEVRQAGEFGVGVPGGVKYDFGVAIARMRKLRARISSTDSAQRYKNMGVDVFIGNGKFIASDAVEVNGKTLKFSRAAVCTGTRPAVLPIPGLTEAGYLTNESVFTLTHLPPRLAVIGGGPVGCETAQAFCRFGSQVWLFERMDRILPKDDPDAAQIVHERMKKDGVCFLLESEVTGVEVRGNEKIVHFEMNGKKKITVDEILLGIGRAPNVEGLDLERAGVEYNSKEGVKVNHKLRTTNPRIFAAGDVCFPLKFTHAADAQARIVIQNALFPHPFGLGCATTESLVIPWCTYTQPELAHAGMDESEAKARGIPVETYTFTLDEVDRAILDGEESGFARVHVRKGTDKILGATIVADRAGDLISEFTLAMHAGAGLKTISRTVYPYPTQAEVVKKVATAWQKNALTEGRKKILRRWFAWTRK